MIPSITVSKIETVFPWNSLKNEVLKNFANFIAKHLRRCLFLIHLQAVGMKLNKTPKQVFSVNFAKSVDTSLIEQLTVTTSLRAIRNNCLGLTKYR